MTSTPTVCYSGSKILQSLESSQRTKKPWVDSVVANTEPERDLLEYVAKYQAKQWLQETDDDVRTPFAWLRAYINKVPIFHSSKSQRLTLPSLVRIS